MTREELKQKAIKASDKKCVKGCSKYYRYGFQDGYIAGTTEVTKELSNRLEAQKETIASYDADLNKAKEQIDEMKKELHRRLVSPSHSDSDCLDKIIGLDRLWQFGQEF